jgi:hypothetical protein
VNADRGYRPFAFILLVPRRQLVVGSRLSSPAFSDALVSRAFAHYRRTNPPHPGTKSICCRCSPSSSFRFWSDFATARHSTPRSAHHPVAPRERNPPWRSTIRPLKRRKCSKPSLDRVRRCEPSDPSCRRSQAPHQRPQNPPRLLRRQRRQSYEPYGIARC